MAFRTRYSEADAWDHGYKSHAVTKARSLNLASVSISASFVLWIQTHHFRLIPSSHGLPDHFL